MYVDIQNENHYQHYTELNYKPKVYLHTMKDLSWSRSWHTVTAEPLSTGLVKHTFHSPK